MDLSIWVGQIVDPENPTGKTVYAEKRPAFKKVTNTRESLRRDAARCSLVKIVDCLMRQPDDAAVVWSYMENNVFVQTEPSRVDACGGTDKAYASTSAMLEVTNFGKVKHQFKVWVFINLYGISKEMADKMHDKDP